MTAAVLSCSWYNLESVILNPLSTVDFEVHCMTFSFMMPHLAVSLGDWFCKSRADSGVGQGRDGMGQGEGWDRGGG